MRYYLFSITLFLITINLSAQPGSSYKTNEKGNTLLWEINGNGLMQPSYLLGTFHLLCKEDIQFSEALKQALKNSSAVYMELDMDDPSVILGGLSMLNMKNGKKLKDLYTEEEYKRLEKFFEDSLKTKLTMFQSMKPMMLSSLVYPRLMGCKDMSGVEEQVMKLCKEYKKEIRGLETMAFQAAMLDSIPYQEQAIELIRTIDSLQKSKRYLDSMIQAYKNQDMVTLERMLNSNEFDMEGDLDVLLNQRNRNWVVQLKTIMSKESVFIAVGAGHLPGEMGVIGLLRKEGYEVRPIENK